MLVNHVRRKHSSSARLGYTRLDRRRLVRRSAAGLAVPAALAIAGLPARQARAQSSPATPVPATSAATPAAQNTGAYASVNGIDLYYEIHGTGAPLVLLHGGLVTIDLLFGEFLPLLAASRQVIAAELQAHGRTADVDRPMSYEVMADDIIALLEHLEIKNTDLFGFSLGGGVSWQVAIKRPDLVRKLIVASAPFARDGWHPDILSGMSSLDREAAAEMIETPLYEAYASVAPRPEDWPTLVTKLSQLLGEDYDWSADVAAIAAPVLYIIGDADSILLEHAIELFRMRGGGIPGDIAPQPASQLAILAGTPHSGIFLRGDLLMPTITPFLDAPLPA